MKFHILITHYTSPGNYYSIIFFYMNIIKSDNLKKDPSWTITNVAVHLAQPATATHQKCSQKACLRLIRQVISFRCFFFCSGPNIHSITVLWHPKLDTNITEEECMDNTGTTEKCGVMCAGRSQLN